MREVLVHCYRPHDAQMAFVESTAKRKVIVAGRRGGKTTGAATLAIRAMMAGRRVLEAAPVADQTEAFWAECKRALAEPMAAGLVTENKTTRMLSMGPGRIRCKTAFNADTLRGDHADLLILDEFSIMSPDAWDEVGAPMLLDNDGDAVFIFTPKRKNHAHSMFVRAQGDDSGRWEAFKFTSLDNPFLSKPALEEITHDMTEDAYKQEIMAEFLDNDGAVFRNVAACLTAPQTTPEQHKGHSIIFGIDWGKSSDYTTISAGCIECAAEVARDRFNQIDYTIQRDRIKAMYEAWNPFVLLAESNAMGEPNIEQLWMDGLPIEGFATTAQSKPRLVENLALSLEREEIAFQDDPIWTGELEAYERKMSPTTGRSTYSAPAGVHDDTVIARALMAYRMRNDTGVFI